MNERTAPSDRTDSCSARSLRAALSPELLVYFAVVMTIVTGELAELRGARRIFGVHNDVALLTAVGGGLWHLLLHRLTERSRSGWRRALQATLVFAGVAGAALYFDQARHEETLLLLFTVAPALGLAAWQLRVAPPAQVVVRLIGGLLAGVALFIFVAAELDFMRALASGSNAAKGWLLLTTAPAALLSGWVLFAVPPRRAGSPRLTALVGITLGAAAVPLLTLGWMFHGSDRVAMTGAGLLLALAAMTVLIPARTLSGADRHFSSAVAGFCTVATAMLACSAVAHLGGVGRPSEIVRVATLIGLVFGHGAYAIDLAFEGRVRHHLPSAFLAAALTATLFLIP